MDVERSGINVFARMSDFQTKKMMRLDRASAAVAAILLKTKRGNSGKVESAALALLAEEIRNRESNSIFSDPHLEQACSKKTSREILCLKLEAICGHIDNGDKSFPWIEEMIDTFEAISTLAQQELEDRQLLQQINERRTQQSNGSPFGEDGESNPF